MNKQTKLNWYIKQILIKKNIFNKLSKKSINKKKVQIFSLRFIVNNRQNVLGNKPQICRNYYKKYNRLSYVFRFKLIRSSGQLIYYYKVLQNILYRSSITQLLQKKYYRLSYIISCLLLHKIKWSVILLLQSTTGCLI